MKWIVTLKEEVATSTIRDNNYDFSSIVIAEVPPIMSGGFVMFEMKEGDSYYYTSISSDNILSIIPEK